MEYAAQELRSNLMADSIAARMAAGPRNGPIWKLKSVRIAQQTTKSPTSNRLQTNRFDNKKANSLYRNRDAIHKIRRLMASNHDFLSQTTLGLVFADQFIAALGVPERIPVVREFFGDRIISNSIDLGCTLLQKQDVRHSIKIAGASKIGKAIQV